MTKNVVEWYFFKNALIETVILEYFFFYFVSANAEYVDRARAFQYQIRNPNIR
jgi:hypothetical protein